jgi:hypothetical protein
MTKPNRNHSAAPRQRVRAVAAEDYLEKASDSCANLETLSGWMAATGQQAGADVIDARLVSSTSALLNREIQQLREALAALHHQLIHTPPGNGAGVGQ